MLVRSAIVSSECSLRELLNQGARARGRGNGGMFNLAMVLLHETNMLSASAGGKIINMVVRNPDTDREPRSKTA